VSGQQSKDSLLNWRQVAAAVFAVGAVAASGPGIAAAAPESDAGPAVSDATDDTEAKPPKADSAADAPDEEAAGSDADFDPEESTTEPTAEPGEVEAEGLADDVENTNTSRMSYGSSRAEADGPEEPNADEPDAEEATAEEATAEEAAAEEAAPEPKQAEVTETEETEETAEQSPPAQPTATELSATAPAEVSPEARPVTTATIVTDVLTWVGLGHATDHLPIPALPVPKLLELAWVAVRQTQYSWNNQRPTTQPTLINGDDGVVVGNLNATDYDDAHLEYTVSTPARFGTVIVNTDGIFTYTPRPGITGVTDTFTVTIDDGPRVHGLGELLGFTGPTSATLAVDVTGTDISSIDVSRPGAVTVQMGTDGRISVIDGTFTDAHVFTTAEAAAVLNAFAPVLGAETGFASTDFMTVQRVAIPGTTEEFYRLRQNVGGIDVIGSDVVLVTDGNGTVTGLFNYNDSRLADVDTTPDISDGSAAAALAAAHLATSTGLQPGRRTVARILDATTADTELVIVALNADEAPSLAWRVTLRAGDTDKPAVGATYYIRANGDDAGEVIVGTSNIQAATAFARDLLGDNRQFEVQAAKWWFFFDSEALVDSTRNITTYATGYSFFGLGTPWLPGDPVTRSLLFGWNSAGVSAHANMAAVYDYYLAVLGRDSLDGAGGTVVTSVGYNPRSDLFQYLSGYTNAFWDAGAQQFAFGDAGAYEAGVDIVAHEYTHGVVSHILAGGDSVLDYGESGALNEAYADLLGSLIEGKSGAGRWLVGEDASGGALRSMANPTAVGSGYRADYALRYTGTGDDAGEHWNSTIFSHAGYLMMTDADTAAVSEDTWAKVLYHSLYRLSPGAKFTDGRAAILDTAAEFGFTDSELRAVAGAFDEVGIVGSAERAGAESSVMLY
jgi:Zn-dependent metalloprotease